MNTVIKLLSSCDYDKIRKSLNAVGLTYPPDSSDSRYTKAFQLLKDIRCRIELVNDYVFETLGDAADPIAELAQCREENVDPERVDSFSCRFKSGEKLINPIIGIMDDDGNFFPAFGNTRSRALKKAGLSTTIIVAGSDLSLSDRKVLVKKLASISNRQERMDVSTDTNGDLKYQLEKHWELVETVDLDSNAIISQDLREAKQEFSDLLKNDTDSEAVDYKKKWLYSWVKKEKPFALYPEQEEKSWRSFCHIYADTFSATRRQTLPSDYHDGELSQLYNTFWSEKDPDTSEELHNWDMSLNHYKNDSKVVQVVFDGGNPTQNSERSILHHAFTLLKKTESLECFIRPQQGLKDIESLKKWRKDLLDNFKEYNIRRHTHDTGVIKCPVITKVVFLQHFTGDDETEAHGWIATTSGGFYKRVQEIT